MRYKMLVYETAESCDTSNIMIEGFRMIEIVKGELCCHCGRHIMLASLVGLADRD